MVKIFIGIPAYDSKIWTDTFISLFNNCIRLREQGIDYIIHFINRESLITRGRNTIASLFLASDCDYLLFVDSDLSFPVNTIETMIQYKKDIIGCSYPKKHYKFKEIAKEINNGMNENDAIAKTSDYIYNANKATFKVENGLIQVEELGTGLLLIHRRVFEKLIQEGKADEYQAYQDENVKYKLYDFFKVGVYNNVYLSEDYFWCRLCKEVGFDIWMSLGIPVSHFGGNVWYGNFSKKIVKLG